MKNLILAAVSIFAIFSCLPLGADAQAIMPRTSAFDRFNGIVASISDFWAGTSVNHTISLNSGDPKLLRKPNTFVFGHQWRMANRATPSTLCSADFTGLVSWGCKGLRSHKCARSTHTILEKHLALRPET